MKKPRYREGSDLFKIPQSVRTKPKLDLGLWRPVWPLFLTPSSSAALNSTHTHNSVFTGKERELQRGECNFPMVLGHRDSIALSKTVFSTLGYLPYFKKLKIQKLQFLKQTGKWLFSLERALVHIFYRGELSQVSLKYESVFNNSICIQLVRNEVTE